MTTRSANDGLTSLVGSMVPSENKADYMSVVGHSAFQAQLLYHTDFMARAVVDMPADDATSAWRQWMADDDQITKLENEEKRLRVRDRVRQAFKWARLYGGSAIIIHDGTGRDRMSEPFDPKAIKRGGLKALVVASRTEIRPANSSAWVEEPESNHYLLPDMWTYQPQKMGARNHSLTIHHSRIVFFRPGDDSDRINPEWWWGDSVLDPMVRLITHASNARSAAAGLMQEANVDVLGIEGMNAKIQTQQGEDQVKKYGTLIRQMKDYTRMALIDKNDEYTRNAYTFSGVKDIVTTLHDYVSAASGIPITRLFGRSPAGMNATGEHDMLNYLRMLSSLQESCIDPAMLDFDEAFIRSALGRRPAKLWYQWRTPDLTTEEQKANIAKTRSETVKNYKASAVIPPPVLEESVRSLLVEYGDLPGAEMAYQKWDEAGNEIDFEDDGGVNPQMPGNQTQNPDDPPVDPAQE